jgi:hypothetical protein
MQSTMMNFVRQRGCVPKTFNSTTCAVAIGLAGFALVASPASALVTRADSSLQHPLKQDSPIVEIVMRRGAAMHSGAVVGPRRGMTSRAMVHGGASCPPRRARRWHAVGKARQLLVAAGRRGRSRRRDRICRRGQSGGMGRCAPGARLLLVLHRREPKAGFLGRLPVTRAVLELVP